MVRHYELSWLFLTYHFEVPVIVLFTKYDQFRRNVEMHMMDFPNEHQGSNLSDVVEKRFRKHYLRPLGNDVKFMRLESGFGSKARVIY